MAVFTNHESLTTALLSLRQQSKIGFVPTMGALHQGHLALVKQAIKENDIVVVSIFVNPTQFDNKTDLNKYPRTQEADIALLQNLNPDVLIYIPKTEELYKGNVVSKKYSFGNLENEMEGKHRKGHFDGVGTVVCILLKAVNPTTAYFGEKDFQQLQIIRKLVEIENLKVKIVGSPIVRENNGLAMSSRNKRLNGEQQEAATLIYKTLLEVQQNFDKLAVSKLTQLVMERFLSNAEVKLEYFEIANEKTLKPAKRKQSDIKYRAFIAAYVGEVRLIDNMRLN